MSTFVTLNPIDPGTDTRVTVRLCSTQDPAHTGANGLVWWPAIVNQPVIQRRFFDGDFTSALDSDSASINIRLEALRASGEFPRVERYDWAGATATIQRLVSGSLVDLAVFKVDSFAAEDMRLALRLAASDEFADADVLTATYAGTTGAEGGADLKGQVKPWVFGRARNVEPVFIDQIDNVFQVSGYGPVQAISAAYERGASFGASVGDFASYAALVAADIPEDRWGTCLAQGMIRLGAPPAGVITVDVDGDNTGGFLRRTGAIIQEIANRLGLGGSVNSASLAALDAAVPRNVNIVIREQTTFLALVQRMVAPCNAVPSTGQSGRLIVSRVAFGAEQFTLDAQGREMPPVLGMARQNTSAPYKRIQMGAARSWRVHSLDEVAFYADLVDRGLYVAGTVYREGDIVASEDKSRWLYVNPTPSSGNAPPAWPTSSNSFWSNLEPPLAPAAIGLEPGATRNVARGTYDAGTTYVRGDIVLFSGSSYQLIVSSSTGNPPPDIARWALLANAGSGPPGADGLPGLTVIVSNEAHVVATAPDGSGGDYSAAGGQMRLLRGDTVLTPTFSVPARTPNTSWISIDSAGNYTVSDPGVDLATATLRATWAGVNYDRTYTLAKSKAGVQGQTGPTVTLVADAQAFTFTDGLPNPAGQFITLNALLNNISGTATWSVTPSIPLGGTGNTRTISVADFGANRQVTVQATLGGIADRITLHRQERNIVAAANANRVPFSRMEGDRGWALLFNPQSLAVTTAYNQFEGMRFFAAYVTATAADQTISIGSSPSNVPTFRLTPGERISFQARVESAGAAANGWSLSLWGFRANGTAYVVHTINGTNRSIGSGFIQDFVNIPSDVIGGRIELYGFTSGAGPLVVVLSEPMVTAAAPGQTVHPPFSPGPNAFDGATVGAPAGTLVAGVEASALTAQAAQAATDATAANASAFAANLAISNITADNILSRDEKPEIRKQRDEIINEYPTIRARAVALGVAVTNYDADYTALIAYLAGLALDSATDTAITRATFNAFFTDYYAERQVVLDGIADQASRRATVLGAEPGLRNDFITVDFDGRVQGIGDGNGTAVANSRVPLGNANRVPFSRMEGDRGWALLFNPQSLAVTTAYNQFEGMRFFRVQATATAAGQQISVGNAPATSPAFRLTPGERISVQARVEAAGAAAASYTFAIWGFQADLVTQNQIGSVSGPIRSIGAGFVQFYVDVPGWAVAGRLEVYGFSSGAGAIQVVISEPMVTSASPGQTVHPPFSPGPNANDGADPNNLITIDGNGLISGIGTGGVFVDNRRAALQGLLSARPASGQFVGQEYHATDTREVFQWDGFNWRASADITATAQRSIEPQFPSIEIKQGEAGHTGNRTVTHVAKRGTGTLTGGTWSLPAQNLGAGSASINSSTGTVTLSGIVQSGSYTVRYTHTDGLVTEITVNVAFIPAPPSAIVSAKTGRATSTNGTLNDNNWQTILSLTLTDVPTGRVNFGGFQGLSFLSPQTGSGTADFEARLQVDGTTLTSVLSQNVVSGGVIAFADFSDLFNGSYAVSGGTRTFTIQMRRTSGTGTINQSNTALEATVIAS